MQKGEKKKYCIGHKHIENSCISLNRRVQMRSHRFRNGTESAAKHLRVYLIGLFQGRVQSDFKLNKDASWIIRIATRGTGIIY